MYSYSLFVKSKEISCQLINYQSVRWRKGKKPFWLGIAKSKLYVIKKPKHVSTKEETQEFSKIKSAYSLQKGSLIDFIVKETLESEKKEEINKPDSNWFLESLKEIEKFNNDSAVLRDLRITQEKEMMLKTSIETVEAAKKKEEKVIEEIEEIVRKEKLLSQSFVTPENLDDAIEKCLSQVVCYNFAIDLKGNRYAGKMPYQTGESETTSDPNDASPICNASDTSDASNNVQEST